MPHLRRALGHWAALCLITVATPATARQAEAIAEALARPILRPGQPVDEVRAYLETRLPKFPDVKTTAEWDEAAGRLRADVLEKVVLRGKAAGWRDAKTEVEWLDAIPGGPGYRIRKLRYEAIPGLWIPALLYEPEAIGGKVPVVLNVNGHDANGKAADYKQIRCINQAKRGMLALNVEWIGMGQLRTEGNQHGLLNAIDLCGTSGVAVHYLAMSRALDLLLEHPHADPDRAAVTGLSGGGWQTIVFSALDTRVTLCDPVAGYSGFRTRIRYLSDLGDSEQTPCDLATVADYTHLTALRAPRPTLLTYNLKDNCCFAAPHALPPLIDAAWPIFAKFGKPGNLRIHINDDPGTHNYLLDNRQALYRMLGDFFYAGDTSYNGREIPSEDEVKTAEQLRVELPGANLDLNKVALDLGRGRPAAEGRGAAKAERRRELRGLLRTPDLAWRSAIVAERRAEPLQSAWRTILVNESWTLPTVELSKGGVKGAATILIADRGRAAAADLARERLDLGDRVVAVDPFYFGESLPKDHDYLWALMLGTVGDRPLGLQASQVLAAARWAKGGGDQLVTIVAQGARSSTVALAAAALDEQAIDGLVLVDPMESLRELIDRRTLYNTAPEQFCFGLLDQFDIRGLKELVEPRPIAIRRTADVADARP